MSVDLLALHSPSRTDARIQVTVVSFWDTDVRIVQGLVNLKTRDMDIRVSPVQSFRDGIRREDGTLDPRFLTLMAYNLADVVPLPR